MDLNSLSGIGYLLFVIPGFVFVWTYRHFTKASQIGEFEYAAWSFIWGVLISISVGRLLLAVVMLPNIPLNDSASLLGGLTGIGLGISSASLVLGLLAALLSNIGVFQFLNDNLSWLVRAPNNKRL